MDDADGDEHEDEQDRQADRHGQMAMRDAYQTRPWLAFLHNFGKVRGNRRRRGEARRQYRILGSKSG